MSEETYSPEIPFLNINRIIQVITDLSKGDWETLKPTLMEAGEFAKGKVKKYIEDSLKDSSLQGLTGGQFSEQLVNCTEKIGKLVHEYATGKIKEKDFVR